MLHARAPDTHGLTLLQAFNRPAWAIRLIVDEGPEILPDTSPDAAGDLAGTLVLTALARHVSCDPLPGGDEDEDKQRWPSGNGASGLTAGWPAAWGHTTWGHGMRGGGKKPSRRWVVVVVVLARGPQGAQGVL